MGDSLHGYMGRRASSSAPRRLCGYLYSPAAQKQMRTRVTRPSNIFAKRTHALGAQFKVWSSRFKVCRDYETNPFRRGKDGMNGMQDRKITKRSQPYGSQI